MGLVEPKNYLVKMEWIPLTDLMGDDYETTDDYIVHVNYFGEGNTFGVLEMATDTPTQDIKGREVERYSEFEVAKDTGDDVYFRALTSPISIEIRVKEAE